MALTLAIVSPTLIFYSTNLRMYAPLFLASMVFIWVVSKLFIKAERLTKKDWLLYFISAVTLVLIDYPGLIVFLVGSVLLSVKFLRMKEKKKLFLIFSPLLSLVVYLPILLSQAEVFLTKKSAIPTQVGGNSLTLFSLGKKIYLYFSPSFDLFSTFDKNTFLALVFPALFLIGLFLSLALVLFNRKRRFEKGLLVVILFGFYWVLFAPFAHGLTRIFLPALFFMPAFLILANQSLPSVINNLNKVLLAGFF
ncbi:MAG TPA: hypothetical protein VLE47_04480, partial [Candidatus Saccharimonadales bacterium]|nr:hypothetical protein [Candidatus Saccharimonadales bacterium]